MNMVFKYSYFENGVYIITEEERADYQPADLPCSNSENPMKVAVAYIRYSNSLSIQEREIILKANNNGFQAVVILVEAATSVYHKTSKKLTKLNQMKEFILSNPNVNTVIFYDESGITRNVANFYLAFVRPVKEKKPNIKILSTKIAEEWIENNTNLLVQNTSF
ncbi:hypothetical protein ACIP9C_04450 [Lysinibacillus sp. NPDC093210]|uniref:hypothetical protein n=1 Tax=Lysinibacillus sp. NPDC093210 TaxID=3364133 RepID=UPI0037FB8DDC